MRRGVSGRSSANVAHNLKGVMFPATKQELIRHAKKVGAGALVVEVLVAFPEEKYTTMADVMRVYGEAERL